MNMKYKGIQYSFEAKNGEKVIIRYVRWEDLNDLIDLRKWRWRNNLFSWYC